MTKRAGSVFVWENFGPTHEDRLSAAHMAFPGKVFGVELSASSRSYSWEGGTMRPFPNVTLFDDPSKTNGLACAAAIVREVRALGLRDVYLCHYQRLPIFLAAVILRLLRFRPILMIDSKADDYPRAKWREWAKRFVLWPYSAALTASHRSREYVRHLGFSKRPIALGYDAVSVERIRKQAAASAKDIAHGERDFLIIARLEPKKNLANALRAYATYLASGGQSRLMRILGSGALEAELIQEAKRLGVDDGVIFEGFVQTDRVSEVLNSAICLLLPSTEEQFGLVVIEAMAMGVPAIVSQNAGAVDLLLDHGINGYVVDPAKPEQMADAMLLLSDDENHWCKMSIAAQAGSLRGDVRIFCDGVRELSFSDHAPSEDLL